MNPVMDFFATHNWVYEAIAIVVTAAVVGELLSWAIRSVLRHAGARPATLSRVRETIRAAWIILAGFGVASAAELTSVLTVLTVSGILGLVVSLSLQTTLSNMVSGVLLLQDRTLRVGDEIEYSGVRGRVVRVALRNTWVETKAGDLAVIGNSSLHGGPLINYTARQRFADLLAPTGSSPPEAPSPGTRSTKP